MISSFTDAITNRFNNLMSLSTSGRKIIGYFCTYTPIEIIHAAGFLPVRITGVKGQANKALAHVPDFICPFMKMSLEKALNGQYDFLSGVVQGYSCDAACGMVNIWKDIFKDKFFHTIPIPYNDSPTARAYLQSAFLELIDKLQDMGGTFREEALTNSLGLYNQIRELLLQLYKLREQGKLSIPAKELMTVIDAGFLLPPETYFKMLNELTDQLPDPFYMPSNNCPVLISGSLIEDPGILDIIESSGGKIVADDLCNGFRFMSPSHGEGHSSMDRLIDRYMKRSPCPSRSRAINRSYEILNMLTQSGAKGVIFVLQKFCTPHLADFPILSEELKKNGYPSLLIEVDETWQMEGQIRTRLEGFFEMIQSR